MVEDEGVAARPPPGEVLLAPHVRRGGVQDPAQPFIIGVLNQSLYILNKTTVRARIH